MAPLTEHETAFQTRSKWFPYQGRAASTRLVDVVGLDCRQSQDGRLFWSIVFPNNEIRIDDNFGWIP